jgi:hypothetical protein
MVVIKCTASWWYDTFGAAFDAFEKTLVEALLVPIAAVCTVSGALPEPSVYITIITKPTTPAAQNSGARCAICGFRSIGASEDPEGV